MVASTKKQAIATRKIPLLLFFAGLALFVPMFLLWASGVLADTSGISGTEAFSTKPTSDKPVKVPVEQASSKIPAFPRQRVLKSYGRLPLSFETNQDQTVNFASI